jgi:hypothetical protein
MSKLHDQLIEDRQLRNAARAVLLDDVSHARTSFSAKGVADRIGGRIGDGAKDVFETAKETSSDKGGIIAALIGVALLWFAREPLFELFGLTAVEDGAVGEVGVTENIEETAGRDDLAPDEIDTTPPGDDDEH